MVERASLETVKTTKGKKGGYYGIAPVMRYEMTQVHVLMFISFLNLNTVRTKIKERVFYKEGCEITEIHTFHPLNVTRQINDVVCTDLTSSKI